MSQGLNRRSMSLKNVIVRRNSFNAPVNLNTLVRVFLLDGSSKVLQMFDGSTVADVLIALRFNLDLKDISTHALFRVFGNNMRRLELHEIISEALKDTTDSGQEVRLLFRSWISFQSGVFDNEVFQYNQRVKQANTALWLAYMEAVFMTMTGSYFLSEEESIMLGCLKMQAESGDYHPHIHTAIVLKQRILARFPNPVRSKLAALSTATLGGNTLLGEEIVQRCTAVYLRIAGYTKAEAQIAYLRTLLTFCPFYGASLFQVQVQYDDHPMEAEHTPPVLPMQCYIGPLALFLVTQQAAPSTSITILRHPYQHIIKFISYLDQHIFTYYVLKPHYTLDDLQQYIKNNNSSSTQDNLKESLEPKILKKFCDLVYLVTYQILEMEVLIEAYSRLQPSFNNNDTGGCTLQQLRPPALPGAKGELLSPVAITGINNNNNNSTDSPASPTADSQTASPTNHSINNNNANRPKLKSRLSTLFSSFTNNNNADSASSPVSSSSAARYGDDVPAVGSSWFQGVYNNNNNHDTASPSAAASSSPSADDLPVMVKYAASMSELQRVADETGFSDNEDDEEGAGDDEGGDEDSGDGQGGGGGKGSDEEGEEEGDEEAGEVDKLAAKAKSNKAGTAGSAKGSGMPSMKAFHRASKILFRRASSTSPKAGSASATTTTSTSTAALFNSQQRGGAGRVKGEEDDEDDEEDD